MSKPPKYTVRSAADLPTSAKNLAKHAAMAGIIVEARSPRKRPEVTIVGGLDVERGIAFTATWVDGRTAGGELYRRAVHYKRIVDTRAEHDARVPDGKGHTKPHPKRKPAGIGKHRYLYLGGPTIPASVGVNELVAVLKGLQ